MFVFVNNNAMAGNSWLACLAVMAMLTAIALACSWSNEGCEADGDCCSRSCFKAHEGTNARCRHSSLGDSCVFDYHCRDDLICGPYYNCCSPYWKMCSTDADCCEKDHVCRPAEGFIYDRCLFPASAPPTGRASAWTIFLVAGVVLLVVNEFRGWR